MKNIIPLIIAAALTLAACSTSDQSKALSAVKSYLSLHTNDGRYTIVENGTVEDFPAVYDTSDLLSHRIREIDSKILDLEYKIKSDSLFNGTAPDTAKLQEITTLRARQDTLRALLDNYRPDTTIVKRILVSFRAKNALGAETITTGYFYLSDDLTRVTNYHNK